LYGSRIYSYFPRRKDWNFLRGEGVTSVRLKNLRNAGSLIGISRGVGFSEKNPFCGGGMDIFWNYTFLFLLKAM